MRNYRKVSETPLTRGVLEIKKMGDSKEEFNKSTFHVDDGLSYEDFLKIKNSKSGQITLKKVSENCGYLRSGETRDGFTPLLAEDFSCYVYLDDPFENYYYTSTIESIDWEKGEFKTKNSTYSFTFKEMSPEEYDKLEENDILN